MEILYFQVTLLLVISHVKSCTNWYVCHEEHMMCFIMEYCVGNTSTDYVDVLEIHGNLCL